MSNDLDDLMQRISEMRTRNQHIEMMAAAYIKATGIHPEQVELVQDTDGNAITWRFRRSKDGDAIDYLGKRVASLIEQNDELRAKLARYEKAGEKACTCKSLLAGHESGCPLAR